jgi:hypothetical protein
MTEQHVATHGISEDYIGIDGIHKIQHLWVFEDKHVHVLWESWFDGPDAEPRRTEVVLSAEGMAHFHSMLDAFIYNPEQFRIPEEK